jgi:hypothetical protein
MGNREVKETMGDLVDAAWMICRNVHIVKNTESVPGSLRQRVGELRRVLERLEDIKHVDCELCNGLGGIAIAGPDKSHPATICPACSGERVSQ